MKHLSQKQWVLYCLVLYAAGCGGPVADSDVTMPDASVTDTTVTPADNQDGSMDSGQPQADAEPSRFDAAQPLPDAMVNDSALVIDAMQPSPDAEVMDSAVQVDATVTPDMMTGNRCEPMIDTFEPGTNRDMTFLAFGDTQIAIVDTAGCKANGRYQADQPDKMIAALNGITNHVWPSGYGFHREGRSINRVRGVLIAGDITENGSEPIPSTAEGYVAGAVCDEFGPFEQTYGLCGDQALAYPVYEGFGNHDFPYQDQFSDYHPVIERIGLRTGYRSNIVHAASVEDAHYVWKWDDIHFVNLNVKPSGTDDDPAYGDTESREKGKRRVDPHRALQFLDEYLGSAQVERAAQIVIMTHYSPINRTRFPEEEAEDFCDVLADHKDSKDVRIVAWIHGHTHKSDYYEWECPRPHRDIDIPTFNVGSPFYTKEENVNSLHFTLFRFGNRTLEAVDVSAQIDENGVPQYQIPGVAYENDDDDHNPDDQYGGWSVVLEDHLDHPDD